MAIATGRDSQGDAVTRRLTMGSNQESIDLAERRRLGREYLARRNQQLLDQEKRRQSTKSTDEPAVETEKKSMIEQEVTSPGSFDQLLNEDGTLKAMQSEKAVQEVEPEKNIIPSAFLKGASFGNPFGDEYELHESSLPDRSTTPKPPVQPKIAFDEKPRATADVIAVPEEDLSFDEQLARALSLSLAESEAKSRALREVREQNDPDMAAAIAASLKDTPQPRRPRQIPITSPSDTEPLIELTPGATVVKAAEVSQHDESTDDELYTLSPGLRQVQPASIPGPLSLPQADTEPIGRTTFGSTLSQPLQKPRPSEQTPISPLTPSSEDSHSKLHTEDARTPISVVPSPFAQSDTESYGFATDSDADDFASLADDRPASRSGSVAQSEGSLIELEDVEDIESVTSHDDGIRTPSSWTDVDSAVGESERSGSEAGDAVRV